jgi:hypothetical protein
MKRRVARAYERLELSLRKFLYRCSPLILVEYLYLKKRGRLYLPHHSRTFEQKLLWLMLYWRHPLKSRCADKYAVRSYVEENGLAGTLSKLHGVYSSSAEIPFDKLPERFVLKCTHGSRFNVFCRDRRVFDREGAMAQLDSWMKTDISQIGGELHYASIIPRIICEAYMEERPGNDLTEYKIFCFDGQAHCTMVCTERGTGAAKFDFYDREWKNKLPYGRSSLGANRNIPHPEAYGEMISAAERLSRPFPFVRMDFYSIGGRAVFSEMTFTPNGCIDIGFTDIAQSTMGDLLRLPNKMIPPFPPSLST